MMLDLPARSEGGADAPAFADALAKQASARGLALPPGLALPFHGFGLAVRVLGE